MTASSASQEVAAILDSAHSAASAAAVKVGMAAGQPWTPELIRYLTVAILVFTSGALLLGGVLLWRKQARSDQILKTLGVLSIVGVSAVLLVAGYSNDQLTPIIGLFGAIAGYLLGKDAHQDPPPRS